MFTLYDSTPALLKWNAVVLPSQAKIPGQAVRHLEIILNVSIERADPETVGHRKLNLPRRIGRARQKCGETWESDDSAGRRAEVQEIALRRPVITKTREIIQPERWLRSAVAIRYETAKDDIARRKIVIDTA